MWTISQQVRERLWVAAPLALTSGLAWLLLALASSSLAVPALCSSALLWSVPTPATFGFFFAYVSPLDLALSWAVMICAMMLPTLADTIGHVRARSFLHARFRLEAMVISGYFSVWLLSGALFLTIALTSRLSAPGGALFALSCVMALLWQVSPWKQRVLNRCHRHPILSAFAPAAHRDAFWLGMTNGASCLASCWALMLAALLVPTHHFTVMALVALFIWAERIDAPRPPAWQLRAPNRAIRLMSLLLTRLRQPQ